MVICLLAGLLAALGLAATSSACSFIRFERGPYVVRDLQIIYSEQEEMTFFVWELRDDASLDLVEFDLYRNGQYEPIDLEETPYPADPYECGGGRLCFQYQVRGRYSSPGETAPLRSRHVEEGTYVGPNSEIEVVETTFDIDPVAIAQNEKIVPRSFDWFASHDVPIERDFQWQFVGWNNDSCGSPGQGWSRFEGRFEVDDGWVEKPRCLAVRPRPEQGKAAKVKRRLPPSAETHFEQQTYSPKRAKPPIVYGVVFDLSIPSEQRCKKVKNTLLSRLRSAIQGRGEHRELGVYTPRSGEDSSVLNGCRQEPRRRLPLSQMINDAQSAAARIQPPDVRVLWIYANNINVSPQPQIRRQLQTWTSGFGEDDDLPVFNWVIGSNTILGTGKWDYTTGWRPIEDETLAGDIRSFAKNFLPFSTMKHDGETEVPIEPLDGVEEPKAFKICQSSPFPVESIGIESGRAIYGVDSPHIPWPASGKPFFRVSLPRQYLVPASNYTDYQINLVVEVCERFCDHRFLTRGGKLYKNWKQTPEPRPLEVCQWRE